MNSKTLVPHTERGTGSKIRFGVLIKGLLRQGLPIGSWRRSDVNCKLLCANVAPWLAFCYYGHEVSCSCREPFKAETTAHRSGGFIMLPHSRCGQTLLLTRFWILETDVKFSTSVWCEPAVDRVAFAKPNTKTCMVLFRPFYCFGRCSKVEENIIVEELCSNKKLKLLPHPSNWRGLIFIPLLATWYLKNVSCQGRRSQRLLLHTSSGYTQYHSSLFSAYEQ